MHVLLCLVHCFRGWLFLYVRYVSTTNSVHSDIVVVNGWGGIKEIITEKIENQNYFFLYIYHWFS